ncbi:DUF4139 domain-containing protein [Epilithonimonas arachidiradicis]|uniref:Uncharacterized protein (TIGR02231 family) n=1 Tax=Epilithonimonas arachidiradicis TaxID=1617282 RepID=A0A420CMK0_9FLAO|nr:DUF4139 domain-containing protein [Epilithonimonas arachidiradicis]RKE79628.1 uncharacterized protein (TIGR02231 family) [Epilithonimonas arachidiradicis]GGG66614.1 hypothetical protein GCM10007332_31710 [Epilithonimonas arachidiradicis]
MKLKHFLAISSSSIITIVTAQKPIFSEAKLKSVMLYEQSAELYSNTTFKIPKGSSEIVIANIAEDIDESSIKIGSKSKVSVLTYRFTDDEDFYKIELDKKNPEHRVVLDSISLMEKKIKDLTIQKTSLVNSIGILDKNQTINSGSTSYSKELEKLIEYYQKKRIDLSLQLDNVENDISKLNVKLGKLQTKFDLNSKEMENYPKGKLVVQVSSDVDELVNLDIKYSVREASWRPYYDVVIPDINSKTKLLYKALIRQNSGLDWKNVELHLISGFPNVHKNIPNLYDWNLYYQQPVPIVKEELAYGTKNTPQADRAYEKDIESVVVRASAFQNQLNVGYDLKDLYTILSNDQDNSINLDINEIPATYTYYTIPKMDKTVFLVAELDNLDKYNLINAEANIIFQDTNVGKTSLNTENTDNKLLLTLGDDRRVSIKRDLIKDKTMEKSISSSNKEQQYAYQFTIRNNKNEKIKLRIKDQVPVSTDKQIIISMVNKGGATYDEKTGDLTWDIVLNANETRKIDFSFKVNSLKNKVLLGL